MNRKHLLAAAVLLCGTDLVTACNGQTAVDGNSEVISSVDVSQEEAARKTKELFALFEQFMDQYFQKHRRTAYKPA